MESDAELIRAIRRGETAAVAAFYERYLPPVWRYACWRLRNDVDTAQDVVSDTFLEAVRGICAPGTQLPSHGRWGGWLTGIARHKVADVLRRRRITDKAYVAWAGNMAGADQRAGGLGTELEQIETKTQVVEVLNNLPDEERLVLELKYIEDLSVREIATQLAKTEKAIESLLFRSRRSFRASFEKLSRTRVDEENVS